MISLEIFKLDSGDDPVSRLKVGEHIFGRGSLLQCDDRRVSRNHGLITITNDEASITSVHKNPCFFQSADSKTITILPKDLAVNLKDGDKFALLADQFWFRIKIINDDQLHTNVLNGSNGTNMAIKTESGRPNDCNQNLKRNCEEESSDQNKRLKSCNEDHPSDSDHKHDSPSDPVPENDTCNKMDSDTTTVIKDLNNEREGKNNQDKIVENEVLSDSEDENDTFIKVNSDITTATNDLNNGSEGKNNHGNVVKNEVLSDTENENDTCINKADTNVDTVKNEEVLSEPEDKQEIKEELSNERVDDLPANSDNNMNVAGISGVSTRPWRDYCMYGLQCYRKNAAHLAEFTHPGDSDYESDPNDQRPICPFGAACYSKKKDHRKAYKHPRGSQDVKKANQTRTKKKDTNVKKRNTRKVYPDESSEDEYDMEDPFMADSGSEYELDGLSDDSSDSDVSEEASEEFARLLKESKRFTRSRKKDRD